MNGSGEDSEAGATALRTLAAAIESGGPDRPVILAGPTASGKSALALGIAERFGGVIVNADALQVWSCWRVLSARPTEEDEARVPHLLYGDRAPGADWSVGHWLRDVAGVLADLRKRSLRPIVVGGTGLYLTALTEGLAEIPPTPSEVRAEAMARLAREGVGGLLAGLDPRTATRIDRANPARVARAWEVLRTTGRGLADWQDETGPALLPVAEAAAFVVTADRDWLARRIDRRFEGMLHGGAIDEVRAVSDRWDAAAPWAQAIGAPEILSYLRGEIDLATASDRGKAASRQYAKRQRTWFRARMKNWTQLAVA